MLDGSEIVTVDKLGELEKRIDDQRFLRCHQSYLVNMEHIADVQENFILRNKASVPIRVRGRKEVVDAYNDYFTRQSAKRSRNLHAPLCGIFCPNSVAIG